MKRMRRGIKACIVDTRYDTSLMFAAEGVPSLRCCRNVLLSRA